MEFAIAKISTKGQIVIPSNLREDIRTGDEFLIIRDQDRIILKSAKKLSAEMKEDISFAKKVEEAWKEYHKGNFKKSSKDDFLKDLRAC